MEIAIPSSAAPDPSRRAVNALLWSVARHTAADSVLLVLAGLVRTAVALALPAVTVRAVTAALTGTDRSATFLLGAMAIVALGAELALVVFAGRVTARGAALLRHRMVDAVLRTGGTGPRSMDPGDLTVRLVGNVEQAASALPTVLSIALAVVTAIGAVLAIGWYSGWLALGVLAAVPVLLLLMRGFLRQSVDLVRRYQEIQAGIAARLADALAGVRTIRAAGTTDREIRRVLTDLPQLNEVGRATWRFQRTALWRVGLLIPITEVLVVAAAGLAVAAGQLPAPGLLAVATYTALALGSLGQVDAVLGLGQIRASAGRIAEVLAGGPVTQQGPPLSLTAGPGELRLRAVRLGPLDRPLLADIDLLVPAGAAVALVGPSGSGKSRLAALVGRLVEPDAGEVLLDGVPLARVALPAVRREIAYAFDRPAVLGVTVRDMITYGLPGPVPDADVVAAARTAGAHDFVSRLPAGYATPVRSAPFSGGEWQRLGLAQALVRRPRVLVLDDATSSLDTLTEERVSAAITRDLAGRTRVVVARRPQTAARCDLVVWLDGGRIRALGRHLELCREADYRALFGPELTAEPVPAADGEGGRGVVAGRAATGMAR